MINIRVHRCTGESATKYQGYVEPEDKSWRVFIDHEGFPHFLIATKHSRWEGEGEPPPETIFMGMANLDHFLDPVFGTVRAMMKNVVCGHDVDPNDIPPEELEHIETTIDFGPDCHTLST